MEKEQIKQELINRYKYIYENAVYVLAPYMYQQTEEKRDRLNKKYRKRNKIHPFVSNDLLIYLKELPKELLLDLESFLLSDTPFHQSKLYIELEDKKKSPDFLNTVKIGLNLLEKDNSKYPSLQTKLDSWKLLVSIRDFINEQSGDLKNKEKKLTALDEYFRINRYSNNGKLWTSGYLINFRDMDNFICFSAPLPKNEKKPSRDKDDTGLKKSNFINYISNRANRYDYNFSVLTEQEKQDIYLTYHDELPWDLEKVCEKEDGYTNSLIDMRLTRPEHTEPCGDTFHVNEEEIFINPDDTLYRYFQLCPHCGYIVNISKEALSDGIKKRIEERCSKDPNLFRKMYLYSELFSLDNSSSEGQKKLLKNNNRRNK